MEVDNTFIPDRFADLIAAGLMCPYCHIPLVATNLVPLHRLAIGVHAGRPWIGTTHTHATGELTHIYCEQCGYPEIVWTEAEQVALRQYEIQALAAFEQYPEQFPVYIYRQDDGLQFSLVETGAKLLKTIYPLYRVMSRSTSQPTHVWESVSPAFHTPDAAAAQCHSFGIYEQWVTPLRLYTVWPWEDRIWILQPLHEEDLCNYPEYLTPQRAR